MVHDTGRTGVLKEFVQRSLDGPVLRELDYDVKLTRQVRRLISEYAIRFNPEEIICDDETADAIWQAALELLETVGIYNYDTNRVIMLGRKEVEARVNRVVKEFVVGAGKDAITIRARAHDSKAPPVLVAVPGRSSRFRQALAGVFIDYLNAYTSDAGPMGDLARRLKGELEGIPHLAKTPGEMIWGRAMARWQRAIAEAMGKAGAWLVGTEEISPAAILACFGDGLLNKFNAHLPVQLMPHLKLNWDRLNLTYAGKEMGVCRAGSARTVLGDFVRSNEEAAVVVAATSLATMAYAGDEYCADIGVVPRGGIHSARGPQQASSAGRRVIERHLGIPLHSFFGTRHGLGTSHGLYEMAALVLARTGSGWSWNAGSFICGPGPGGEQRVDLDHKFVTAICRGAAGLSREKTNELVLKLLPFYEGQEADNGKPFFYYYDIKTLTPSKELVALYERAEEELQRLGVPMAHDGASPTTLSY